MVSRRWMWWALAGATAALWLARPARAETEEEYLQGPFAPRSQVRVPGPAGKVAAVPAARASAPARPASAAAAAKPPAFAGYAAESARTATRLPPEERFARDFLRTAALHARFEVEAARLAMQRAQSPAVLAFASGLLQDHQGADAELVHLLAARGMAPPMMDNAQRKVLNRLGRLKGAKFDREFVERLGSTRQRGDVEQYEKAAAGVGDPAIRAWIDRQLPLLREQHASAARLGEGRAEGRGDPLRPKPVGTREAAERRR